MMRVVCIAASKTMVCLDAVFCIVAPTFGNSGINSPESLSI
jgi:hypothetical protein